jgi:glycosyltransferase involved in cell wall biosynthesis
MQPHEEWADVIIVQGHALQHFPSLETTSKVLIVDIYDPLHLEQLEQGKDLPFNRWNDQIAASNEALNHQMLLGDFFLCASDRQRNFWLGQLAALGRVNAYTYSRDSELDSLIAVAPFGIPSEEPVVTAPAIRGVVPGISESDKVIIWGGGIYNWFDPQTLIRAVATLAKRRPNVRLFFLGVKHPNKDVPEMSAVAEARILATELGVDNKNVFFNETWVPYEDRQNYLMEADVGVSTHFAHVETKFSFRTRILDYLWAGLPIVSTQGDSFGDLVGRENLGASVPERDEQALVNALEALLFDDDAHAAAKSNVMRVREQFTWERVLKPLVDFCNAPVRAADRASTIVESVSSRNKLVARVGGQKSSNHRGLRRDIDRVMYYLKNGGVAAVLERIDARRTRKQKSKLNA